jgi:hypothetical protein
MHVHFSPNFLNNFFNALVEDDNELVCHLLISFVSRLEDKDEPLAYYIFSLGANDNDKPRVHRCQKEIQYLQKKMMMSPQLVINF